MAIEALAKQFGRNHQILGCNSQDQLSWPFYSREMGILSTAMVITLALSMPLVVAWVSRELRRGDRRRVSNSDF
jgi:hypothetical protein